MMSGDGAIGDEWRFTSNSRKSCSRKPHACHHVTKALVRSRSNNMMTTMIHVGDDGDDKDDDDDDDDESWLGWCSSLKTQATTASDGFILMNLMTLVVMILWCWKDYWEGWRWGLCSVDMLAKSIRPSSNMCSHLINQYYVLRLKPSLIMCFVKIFM